MITADDVRAARRRTADYIRETPMIRSTTPSGTAMWFKAEYMQKCGVFKTRGAFNRQLRARENGLLDPEIGVVAASGGNAGLAHAYAASVLGVPAIVFVPETAPQVKVDRLTAFGADVRRVGTEYADAFDASQTHVAQTGALFCHAYDQPDIAAGAGVVALEILDTVPDVDTILVSVGGGGLFAGIATVAAERGVRVVAVEPRLIPTLHDALAAGRPVDVAVSGVAADSLGARRVGDIGFAVASATDTVSVLVDDDDIVDARRSLWDEYRIPAEHGAAAYAALRSGAYVPDRTATAAVIVCGANTDPRTLA